MVTTPKDVLTAYDAAYLAHSIKALLSLYNEAYFDRWLKRVVRAFHRKVSAPNDQGCTEWTGFKNSRGYGVVHLGGRLIRAHRVSWELTNGPIPAGLFICHTCDNPSCVNPQHLYAGTHEQNMEDRTSRGRNTCGVSGEANHLAKLSNTEINDIRASKSTALELAGRYGITRNYVYLIRRNETRRGNVAR